MSFPEAEIRGLRFGLVSDEYVQRTAVRELDKLTPKKHHIPVTGSINCTSLGTTTNANCCVTCGNFSEFCTGHCGRITLFQSAARVSYFHVSLKILASLCISCGKLLLKDHPRIARLLKLGATGSYKRCVNEVSKLTSRVKVCPHDDCGTKQPDLWLRWENLIIRPVFYISKEEDFAHLPIITPNHLHCMLKFASPDTIRIFGFDPIFSPLEALMERVLLVAPPLLRPSRSANGKSDDITLSYENVMRINQEANPDVVPNLTMAFLRDEKLPENMTITAAKKKLKPVQGKMSTRLMRKKQPVVPECLDDYFLLQVIPPASSLTPIPLL